MVNTSEFIKEDWITKEMIGKGKIVVIMPTEARWDKYTYQGTDNTKLLIDVSMDQETYELSLGKKAVKVISAEYGENTINWAGKKLDLFIDTQGDKQFINARPRLEETP